MKNTVFAFLSLSTAVSTMGYAADGSLTEEDVAAQIAAETETTPQVAASVRPQANAAQQNLVSIPDDTLGHIASFFTLREHAALSQVNQALHTQQPKLMKAKTTRLLESAFQSGTIEPDALSELKKVAVHLPELFNGAVKGARFSDNILLQVPTALSPLLVHLTEYLTPLLQGENLHYATHKLFDVPADEAIENWQSAAVQHYFRKKRFYHEAAADVGAVTAAFDSLLDSVQADFSRQHYVNIDTFLEHHAAHRTVGTPVPRTTLVMNKRESFANRDQLERILARSRDQLIVIDLPVDVSRGELRSTTSERYEINLNLNDLPRNIQNLAVVCQPEAPIRIGNRFLQHCYGLQSLDFSPLSHVRKVGNNFLKDCSGLQSLNLSPLSKVKKIGGLFLTDCSGLQSLDLSPLSQVTEVGEFFLSGCDGLQSLDLSPLSRLTKIGLAFLSRCCSLQSLDLSPLSQVTKISYSLLAYCRNIKSIYITNRSLAQQVLQKIEIDNLTIYVPFSDSEIAASQETLNRTTQNIQLKQVAADFDFAAVSGNAPNEASHGWISRLLGW